MEVLCRQVKKGKDRLCSVVISLLSIIRSYFNESGQVCNTLNFEYTEKQAQQVMNQTEFNMVVNKDKIIEVLNWVIDR